MTLSFFSYSTIRQRAACARHLSALLSSGLPLLEALRTVASVSSPALRIVLISVAQSVESGNTLAQSLSKFPRHFSPLFISLVQSGELSGSLAHNLIYIAAQMEKERQFLDRVRSALLYPSLVLLATIFLGVSMVVFILPKIIPLFRGLRVDLPLSTTVLLFLAQTIEQYGVYLFVGGIACVICVWVLWTRTWFAPTKDAFLIRIPIIGSLLRDTLLARLSYALGTLLQSGLHIDEALTVSAQMIRHTGYRRLLERAVTRVRSGGTISQVCSQNTTLFPPLFISMIAVSEQSGEMMETFTSLGTLFEQEADARMKTMTTLIEPVLLLCIGGVVGWLALSIISPIYDITGNVRR